MCSAVSILTRKPFWIGKGGDFGFLNFFFLRIVTLFSTAVSVVFARIFSVGLFIVSARVFLPHDNASFILAITLPQLVVQLGTLGWLPLIRREASRMTEDASPISKGFILRSIQIPMLSVAMIGAILFLFGVCTGEVNYYAYISILSILYSAVFIGREYLSALRYPTLSILLAEALPFAFGSCFLWLVKPGHVELALLIFIFGTALSLLAQFPIIYRHIGRHVALKHAEYKTSEWMKSGFFSLLGAGGRTILDRLDVIVLSIFALSAELSIYNSGLRVANILLLPPIVLLPVFSPHISKAYEGGDIFSLRGDMLLQTFLVGVSVVPMAAVLLAFPAQIIGFVFGEEYGAVDRVMGFIIMAQVMFAFSLPWSNLFLMKNGERTYGFTNLAALVLAASIAFGLTDSLGAIAVAIASMTANTLLFVVFLGLGVTDLFRRAEG